MQELHSNAIGCREEKAIKSGNRSTAYGGDLPDDLISFSFSSLSHPGTACYEEGRSSNMIERSLGCPLIAK